MLLFVLCDLVQCLQEIKFPCVKFEGDRETLADTDMKAWLRYKSEERADLIQENWKHSNTNPGSCINIACTSSIVGLNKKCVTSSIFPLSLHLFLR